MNEDPYSIEAIICENLSKIIIDEIEADMLKRLMIQATTDAGSLEAGLNLDV